MLVEGPGFRGYAMCACGHGRVAYYAEGLYFSAFIIRAPVDALCRDGADITCV